MVEPEHRERAMKMEWRAALLAMNSFLSLALLVAGLCCFGCGGKDPNAIGSRSSKQFASADPQTKEQWETALAAMKTNGYAVAYVNLQSLAEKTNLTAEQLNAVHETVASLSDKMYEAANKGDQEAVKAIQELRGSRRR